MPGVTLNVTHEVTQLVVDGELGAGWTEDGDARVIVARSGALEVVLIVRADDDGLVAALQLPYGGRGHVDIHEDGG